MNVGGSVAGAATVHGDAGEAGAGGAGGDQGGPDYRDCFVTPPTDAEVLFGTVCTNTWDACHAIGVDYFDICDCVLVADNNYRLTSCRTPTEEYFSCLESLTAPELKCPKDQLPTPRNNVCVAEHDAATHCS